RSAVTHKSPKTLDANLHPISPPLLRVHIDKWVFAHSAPARGLSLNECGAWQGFPRDYLWDAPLRGAFRGVGNAVPPPPVNLWASSLPAMWWLRLRAASIPEFDHVASGATPGLRSNRLAIQLGGSGRIRAVHSRRVTPSLHHSKPME